MLLGKLKIFGHSMEPTLKNNDTVLVTDIFYVFKDPKINDIVAFRFNQKIFVKRITKLFKNKYLLEGDNKKDSLDGRNFGLIKRGDVLGKVFKII